MAAALVCPAGAGAGAGATEAQPMAHVIVTLRQDATSSRPGHDVEATLRSAAAVGQRRALALLRRRRASGDVRLVRSFWVFNGLEVIATRAVLRQLAALPEVQSVRVNASLSLPRARAASAAPAAPSAPNVALVGAPALWATGITGAGVVVASLDSGVDASHPDLAPGYRGGTNSWFDPSGQHPTTPTDATGHGTATMGVMVGSGASGTTYGVAPGAHWIAAKIFDDRGRTTSARIHRAFQWLLDPDGNPRTADAPQVVNGSWDLDGSGCDLEFETDLEHLRAAGVLPVFASGNNAREASPANNPSAFAVGGVDLAGGIDPSSGRGRSSCGQPVYPQLVAPGVDIPTTDLFGFVTTQTGTSVAAPHVSGALALLLSKFPHTSAQRQEAALEASAVALGVPGPDSIFGFGRLDVSAAAAWLATARDVTLTPSAWALAATAGRSASVKVSAAPLHGFTSNVGLVTEGLPKGARAVFAPATIRRGRGTATLTVRTTRQVRPGTYPLTIRGTGGSRTRAVTISFVVRRRR